MKPSILFASLLVASSAILTGVSANPKGLGRSAIEAARLKQRPPANYLAHYLPDDRYKIAGKVWKFVSTDLDTYYHVPQSPNMLRQPASNVIGFANARDAEEAGYVADPSDGTVGASQSERPSSEGGTGDIGGGFNDAERQYLLLSTPLLQEAIGYMGILGVRLQRAGQQLGTGGNLTTAMMEIRPVTAKYLKQSRNLLSRFNRLRPPPRMKRVHAAVRTALIEAQNSIVFLDNMTTTGDVSNLGPFLQRMQRSQQAFVRAGAEYKALGIK